MSNVIRPDNFRAIASPARGVVKAVAEAGIKLAEEQGDHEKVARLRAIWEGYKRDQWPF